VANWAPAARVGRRLRAKLWANTSNLRGRPPPHRIRRAWLRTALQEPWFVCPGSPSSERLPWWLSSLSSVALDDTRLMTRPMTRRPQ
jgi:hypothetical protein